MMRPHRSRPDPHGLGGDPAGGRHGRRPLGHGDLRLLLLAQIERQPRHGYELIRLIAELFHGIYTPSAGAVYPTLAAMEQQGWIAADADDGRKRYAITDAGRAQADAEREAIDAALARTHRSARDLAKANMPAPVREALRRIKRGLVTRHGRWDDAEIARVAALLDQAADGMDGPA
jgi:DNA-binding PadR family transcriptional regulator